MNRVLNGVAYPVGWIFNPVATLSETTETVKNSLSAITAGLLFVKNTPVELIKLVERCEAIVLLKDFSVYLRQLVDKINPVMLNALPTVSSFLATFESAKDYLTFLEFFTYVRDCGDKNLKDKSFAKQANLACKLAFSTLETFLLIPNKFNWINLGKFCETIGLYSPFVNLTIVNCLKLTTSSLVMASSVFSIWSAQEEIDKAHGDIEKNSERMTYFKELGDQLVGKNEITLEVQQVMRDHFKILTAEDAIVKNKKISKLSQTYRNILNSYDEIISLNIKMNSLRADPHENASKIAKLNLALEAKKVFLKANQEKAARSVLFYKCASNTDLGKEALRNIKNEFIKTRAAVNISTIQDPQNKEILNQFLNENPPLDFSGSLATAIKANRNTQDNEIFKSWLSNANSQQDFLIKATKTYKNQKQSIDHIIDYKSYKASQNYVGNEASLKKAKLTQVYEISKIAIVALASLTAILIPAGVVPAFLITYAAGVGTGTWLAGLGICITGAIRTIYTVFWWNDPKKMARPTTSLCQLAV